MVVKLLGKLTLYTFQVSERIKWFRLRIGRPFAKLLFKLAVRAHKKKGIDGWTNFHIPLWRSIGRERSKFIKRKMNIDPNDAHSIGTYQDYEDPILGIEGYWQENGKNKAIRIETSCPYGDYLRSVNCADVCRVLVCEFENATGRQMNPNYRLEPLNKTIANGDDNCEFIHRLS